MSSHCSPVGWLGSPAREPSEEGALVLAPSAVHDVRVLTETTSHLVIYNPAPGGEPALLIAMRVLAGGETISEKALARELFGDPRYGELNAILERMPEEISHSHGNRYFAPEDAPVFRGAEVLEQKRRARELLRDLQADLVEAAPFFVQESLPLPLERVFSGVESRGTRRTLVFEVDYADATGRLRTASAERAIRWLGPWTDLPSSYASGEVSYTVYSGDLHVHSCHGEAVGACAPSTNCFAESTQVLTSVSYAELKQDYKSLGHEWFAATDHSYCINDAAEYQAIVDEIDAIDVHDPDFVAMPDIELSSDEEGTQEGSDVSDAFCTSPPTPQNHMGAHGICERIHGGKDDVFGYCDETDSGYDALSSFQTNITTVGRQGGYTIVHHPASPGWAWNSREDLEGLENDRAHGVEIFNGDEQVGQGGNVGAWVDWLLDGRILYAYGGSDTHDNAFDFGANHVLFEPSDYFDRRTLEGILKQGHSYVSNQHALIMDVVFQGETLLMGTVKDLPPGTSSEVVDVNVHYNFGSDSATITIFKGVVGDASETELVTSGALSGEGTYTFCDDLEEGERSWYRAYSFHDPGGLRDEADGLHEPRLLRAVERVRGRRWPAPGHRDRPVARGERRPHVRHRRRPPGRLRHAALLRRPRPARGAGSADRGLPAPASALDGAPGLPAGTPSARGRRPRSAIPTTRSTSCCLSKAPRSIRSP